MSLQSLFFAAPSVAGRASEALSASLDASISVPLGCKIVACPSERFAPSALLASTLSSSVMSASILSDSAATLSGEALALSDGCSSIEEILCPGGKDNLVVGEGRVSLWEPPLTDFVEPFESESALAPRGDLFRYGLSCPLAPVALRWERSVRASFSSGVVALFDEGELPPSISV